MSGSRVRRWLASLLLCLVPGVAQATTLTATPGTLHAVARQLRAGDTLVLTPGVYAVRLDNVLPSGSVGQPTTLRGEAGAVLRPPDQGRDTCGLCVQGREHLLIQDLVIDASAVTNCAVGVHASHDLTLERLTITGVHAPRHAPNGGGGICTSTDSHHLTIRGNHVTFGPSSSRLVHGIYVAGPDNVIAGNTVEGSAGYGIHVYSDSPTREQDTARNVIRGNTLRGNARGIFAMGSGTQVCANAVEGGDAIHWWQDGGRRTTQGPCPGPGLPPPGLPPRPPVPIPSPPPPVPQWTGVTVVFAWEYPVVQHHDTQFYLQIRQGGVGAREQLLPPLDAPTCARYPDPQRTAETLCGRACLAPGQYDFSLQAFRIATGRSRDSNSISVHLTRETCLLPAAPLPPVPTHLRVLKVDPSVPERLVLAWEFPTDPPLTPTFLLQTTALVHGSPTKQSRALDVLPVDRCASYPDPARTGNTVCAALCLEPADYSLAVTAHLPLSDTHTLPTNTVDVDLSGLPSCTTPMDRTPLPPPPKDLGKKDRTKEGIGAVVAGGLIVGGVVTSGQTVSLPSLINLGCVSWKVLGPCACGFPPQPCLQVEYSEPAWIVEVVKTPGSTTIPIFGSLLHAVLMPLGVPVLGGGGMGRSSGSGQSNLAYNEVHVYRLPNLLGGPCTACAPTPALPALHYASEIDPVWRTATASPLPVDVVPPIGTWQRMYPRGGHVIHGSEPIAAAVAAVRAMDIVRQPVGTPPHAEAHVVTNPAVTDYSCMQMASPRMSPCMPPGTPVPLWETGAGSPRGTFVYLFWQKRICCVHPGVAACGIATPGIGGHGMNLCLFPSIPPVP